tara:strand:+ start:353 stop:1762 length:1410 start_codon:yes stop_codon:yes gene_type:complete
VKYLTLLLFFIVIQTQAADVKAIWPSMNFKQKLEVFRVYKRVLGSQKNFKVSKNNFEIFDFIQKAHANELNCIYAGWPSSLVNGFCSNPSNMNPSYQTGSCAENELHCQPLLFGEGLCVPGRTRAQRNSSFKNCRQGFGSAGRSHENLLRELLEKGKEAELLELFQFAENICEEGRQSSTGMCRTLENLVSRLRTKLEGIEVVETFEETTRLVADIGIITSQRCVSPPTLVEREELEEPLEAVEPIVSSRVVSPSVVSPSVVPPRVDSPRTPTASTENLVGPALALAEIQTGSLRYIGRGMMNGDGPIVRGGSGIRTCVFESEEIYLLYRGCMGNKQEAPNLEFTVIEKTGQITQFYLETPHEFNGSLSRSGTEVYNGFRITRVDGSPISDDLTMEQIRDHSTRHMSYNSNYPRCSHTDSVVSNYSACEGNPTGGQEWLNAASNFRANPPALWLQTLQNMRQLIVDTTY